jgi:hypothetical protein
VAPRTERIAVPVGHLAHPGSHDVDMALED